MLVSTQDMLRRAWEGGCAVPSPDFVDANSARAYCQVASELRAPLILSFAEVHLTHLSLEEAVLIGRFYAERADAPIALHLDHGVTFSVVEEAIARGFTSVMIDASGEELSENIRRTREVVELAHAHGVAVEAEIGHVGTEEEGNDHALSDNVYTEVGAAQELVQATGVDSLAVSIGTKHGAYRGEPHISFERLAELNAALGIPLVLHGGSGSGDDNLRRCAQGGVAKVNLYTDFIVAARDAVYEQRPDSWPKMLSAGDEAMKDVLRHYYRVLGCAR